ncbi:MAG: hypothetical protein HY898_26635 [Deltaproteobacteria bacterium]|nr:hypothetical protein [Deltaproteobacteria bacterium]
MATIEIVDDNLIIHILGLDKLLSLRSSLTVPLKHIRAVSVRPPDARGEGEIKAYRVAGAYIPGAVTAGYFWVSGGLPLSPKPAIDALTKARTAVEQWAHEEGGHKQRAMELVSKALDEVTQGANAAKMPLDDEGKGWAFYDMHDASKTIGMDVEHEKIRRIVIEIDGESPEDAAEKIKTAIERVAR